MFLKIGDRHFFCLQILLFFIAQIDSRYAQQAIYQSDIESVSEDEEQLFEGDIIGWHVGDVDANDQHTALSDRNFRWPNGEVIFNVSKLFSCYERCMIYEAMREIESKTCVSFKEIDMETNEGHFAQVLRSRISKSHIGYVSISSPPSQQPLYICVTCFDNIGSVLHELMHTLGFLHEHTRFDRDEYITIHEANIKESKRNNFIKQKHEYGNVTTLGFGYDYYSVTHYAWNAFATNNSLTTIAVKGNESIEIGQRLRLSNVDVQKINKYYNCQDGQVGCLDKMPNCKGAARFQQKCETDKAFRGKCSKSCNLCTSHGSNLQKFNCTDPVRRCQRFEQKAKMRRDGTEFCIVHLREHMLKGHKYGGIC